jgi:hypothetical protein
MRFAVPFLIASLSLAQPKQEQGKQVIDEALAALGGEQFLAMKDRVETGRAYSFYRDRLTGLAVAKIYTRYMDKAPEGELAQLERQTYGKDEDSVILFLPDNAYQITYRGAKPLQTERFRRYLDSSRRNIFYILRHRLKEPGMIFESQGTLVWQNAPVNVVDIIDAENNVVRVYFHRTTKLPLRQEFQRRDPKTKERDEEVSVFAKYRDIGNGVQWPFTIMAERNGEKLYEMYSETVTINQGLTDDLFTLPGTMKVLAPDRNTTP